MDFLSILAQGFVSFVSVVCMVLYWMLIIRIVLSYAGVHPLTHGNELVRIIFQTTDVILSPFERLPLRVGPLDLSPILLIIILGMIPRLVESLIFGLLRAVP